MRVMIGNNCIGNKLEMINEKNMPSTSVFKCLMFAHLDEILCEPDATVNP